MAPPTEYQLASMEDMTKVDLTEYVLLLFLIRPDSLEIKTQDH